MSARCLRSLIYSVLGLSLLTDLVTAFDNSRKDNLAIYWGQDGANSQQPLAFYCQDDTVNVIPLAFLYILRGTGGDPVIDFANTCNQWDDSVFSGTALANCQAAMSNDIKFCQSKGKLVTLSIGGATGQVGFSSDSQAQTFATQVWNLFLGGSSSTRPFGNVVLDGIDLDIESGTPAHYAAFVNKIRSLAAPTGKSVYITAAPQCPYPDAYIGAALNAAPFDAVYVQFYNNYCGLDAPDDYNFATWDNWAKTTSANKNVKVYIGAAGSADAAGTGYVDASTLASYASDAQSKYSSFGGVMMWDADTAYNNNRFDKAVKQAIVASAAKLGGPPEPPKQDTTSLEQAASSTPPVHKTSFSPAPSPTSSSALSHVAKPTFTTLRLPTDAPRPDPPVTVEPSLRPVHSLKKPDSAVRPHETINWAASADAARWQKAHRAGETATVKSRFFRG